MAKECSMAVVINAFAFFTASSTVAPFARFAAMAEEIVQPVPCVFLVFILHFLMILSYQFF